MPDKKGIDKKWKKQIEGPKDLSISSDEGQRPQVNPGNYPCNVPMQENRCFQC